MTLFIRSLIDDYFQADITCLNQKKDTTSHKRVTTADSIHTAFSRQALCHHHGHNLSVSSFTVIPS